MVWQSKSSILNMTNESNRSKLVGSASTASLSSIKSMVSEHLTYLPLDAQNRMLRLGFGKHDGKWFARADLWFFGVRIS